MGKVKMAKGLKAENL